MSVAFLSAAYSADGARAIELLGASSPYSPRSLDASATASGTR